MTGLCSFPLFLTCGILAVFLAPRVIVAVTPGTLRWTYPLSSSDSYYSRGSKLVFGPDGTLFAAAHSLYAIATVDDSSVAPGSLKWKFTTRKDSNGIDTPPQFGPNGTLYLATSSGDIVALDAAGNSSVAAGSVKWTHISNIK